jgi:hypothetical protein
VLCVSKAETEEQSDKHTWFSSSSVVVVVVVVVSYGGGGNRKVLSVTDSLRRER